MRQVIVQEAGEPQEPNSKLLDENIRPLLHLPPQVLMLHLGDGHIHASHHHARQDGRQTRILAHRPRVHTHDFIEQKLIALQHTRMTPHLTA